jgi:hypothetical protein
MVVWDINLIVTSQSNLDPKWHRSSSSSADRSTDALGNGNNTDEENALELEKELGPPRLEIQMRWEISAMYSGTLVKGEAHECSLSADVFVACCPVTWRVVSAQFSFNAADLMQQLGVLHESAWRSAKKVCDFGLDIFPYFSLSTYRSFFWTLLVYG